MIPIYMPILLSTHIYLYLLPIYRSLHFNGRRVDPETLLKFSTIFTYNNNYKINRI